MKLNCKAGDLAVVVKSEAGNEGKIVRCLRYLGYQLWRDRDNSPLCRPTWEIDQGLYSLDGSLRSEICDDQLRPIRDPGDDAKDESLSWLPPVPNDISAEDPQDLREALKQWAEEQR